MLNRVKVLHELSVASDKLFIDRSDEYQEAYKQWQLIAADPLFLQKVQACPSLQLPTWIGSLADVFEVTCAVGPYQIVSVDGSQIYPDKHQGTGCFLVNIGTVLMRYGMPNTQSRFSSEPYLFLEQDIQNERIQAVDFVNGKREELEFTTGLEVSVAIKQEYLDVPLLLLFDGSLIFWHLESKEDTLKNYFLKAYSATLQTLCNEKIPVVGYLSLTKSKDLVNLLRAHMTQFSSQLSERTQTLPHVVDASIADFFLKPGQRSTFFRSNSPITHLYPEEVRPWFCYYATGSEMVRLEFPQYVVFNPEMIEQALALVVNQIAKGNGYPVSIAEAHVQAVVKGPDRDFFYHAIEKYGVEQKRRLIMSQKNAKKRRMCI